MDRLISGIRTSGNPHLGNYLGAIQNFVRLQNSKKYNVFVFVADYHSLSDGFDPSEKQKQILDVTADYIAAGLDPRKSVIFLQSDVPESTELAWILGAITPIGELGRMTQFKEKAAEQKENINAALFNYPILMAADILLYDVKIVPVGDDQMQHLELTRSLARKFNSRFGKTFVEPKPLLTEVPRLMSLDNPEKKMSKSSPKGCLFIDDEPDVIREKLKRAVTDSGNKIEFAENKPAISNLINIYRALSGKSLQDVETKFAHSSYSEFKNELAELIVSYFAPFRKTKKELMKNPGKLKKVLADGAKKARPIAEKKMLEVKKRIGII